MNMMPQPVPLRAVPAASAPEPSAREPGPKRPGAGPDLRDMLQMLLAGIFPSAEGLEMMLDRIERMP
ncbi:hypothetical protein [Phaeovulum sp. W22_SRMD_FR3]|uniref:hypothetical protein n=1 Tax=Phaeovulum sp. W22_SRMD_FR3 TaxID=3240274 RepID=UPI003F9B4C3E